MDKILIIDDETDIRDLISDVLVDEGYKVICASNAKEALTSFQEESPDAVILDIWLEGSEFDGIGVLKRFKQLKQEIPVIMISGHGNIETAVDTIKFGAYDFIEKPFKEEKLLILLKRALEATTLARENIKLKEEQGINCEIIGSSKYANTLRETAKILATNNSRILITGDQGTGKELFARYVHKHSERAKKPFVKVYANNITDENAELELFGTDTAKSYKSGLVELANGGVLYIDEVAELPKVAQNLLLKFLQEGKYCKIGSEKIHQSDARLISSTSKSIDESFNKSLYYRLTVANIELQPLNKHREDIVEYINKFSKINFSQEALSALMMYDWSGNIRQLKNMLELVSMLHSKKKIVDLMDLPSEISGICGVDNPTIANDFIAKPLKVAKDMFEKEYLEAQLKKFSGNISKTAEFVGMERTALHRKLKSLGINLSKSSL